jgi:hypothetical protein
MLGVSWQARMWALGPRHEGEDRDCGYSCESRQGRDTRESRSERSRNPKRRIIGGVIHEGFFT